MIFRQTESVVECVWGPQGRQTHRLRHAVFWELVTAVRGMTEPIEVVSVQWR